MSQDRGFRPAPTLAKRLNRNALTVAAVIMGMTVLTAVVVLSPGRGSPAGPTGGVDAGMQQGPSRPTFLDEPARGTRVAADSTPTDPSPVPPGPPAGDDGSLPPAQLGIEQSGMAGVESAREQAFEAALRSSVLAAGSGAPAVLAHRGREGAGAGVESAEEQLLHLGDSLTRSSLHPQSAGSAATRQREFLSRAGDAGGAAVLARLEPAGSPYTLQAGAVLPGVLITAINSDLPGEIVGQVSRNVYDSRTQRLLLVPKGAKLIGTYDNQVAAGQGRLLVAWTRLTFPDGRSLKLPGLALKDPEGQTGAADRVDHHYRRVFGKALLLSAISAGAQLSQPRQGSIPAAPSAGQVAAGAMGQELSNVALEILRRGMDVAPTITIRQGQPFLVFLNGDVVFDGPYQPEP